MAEATRRQLDQFERSRFLRVPRFANLFAMFGQFVKRVFLGMLRSIVTAVSLTTCSNIGVVYPHCPLLSTPGALTKTPLPMGPQTCWKSCGTLPWRSCTFMFALKFRPLRGSEFPVARGLHCVMHPASPRSSCTASVAATSRGCFRCRGWMRRLRCRQR